jgi:hypothetical protein
VKAICVKFPTFMCDIILSRIIKNQLWEENTLGLQLAFMKCKIMFCSWLELTLIGSLDFISKHNSIVSLWIEIFMRCGWGLRKEDLLSERKLWKIFSNVNLCYKFLKLMLIKKFPWELCRGLNLKVPDLIEKVFE